MREACCLNGHLFKSNIIIYTALSFLVRLLTLVYPSRSLDTSFISNIDLLGENSLAFAVLAPVLWHLGRSQLNM